MSDLLQRYGVFLNVENPEGDARDALGQTVRTAIAAEELGFHAAWVAEHHYSPFAIGSALTVLLSHIAACTSTIRLGTGASLLALNDPLRVAEDIASLDLLSGGRIEFGVARGGPFPEQYRHAGIASADVARERMHEALALIQRLWNEPQTRFDGRFFHYEGVAVYPRPLQRPVPVWLASLAGDSQHLAEQHGYGLMATPSADFSEIAEQVAAERARRGDFPFAIARFFHCDEDSRHAVEHGVAAVRAYPRLMGVQFPSGKLPPMFAPGAPEAVILANSIIGTPEQCVARAKALRDRLGPYQLLLKPATHDPVEARASLALFARAAGLAAT
ncbi:LLM class flavin-dependent oxidoreductase [Paraburkholderia tropica]|uniref:Flavin-dependent oxidoreductase, luciferase family (Includes alkanesulfonate monooxygenase SsuD and methylene tetrahydromethanopterin reductase) n=1 Tax=Paraburkholderia tropica TaxID=92647 RepID=A0AAQ1GNZ4_9BURK|nr:LLM class flavin-dependent oxidoreductase [Paraburkholderia tropica]RQN36312.1 LLM class flavin-dependent oxidoreductase [Paraburkholderia tropica]SEK14995.1 Flavin-dependent oxidoreductase, luciferase family (includes alkanesulfonate monooxygenase SsuD and methylene tetrahydromethanopterin reductase) [Paraburkholderia tropica]